MVCLIHSTCLPSQRHLPVWAALVIMRIWLHAQMVSFINLIKIISKVSLAKHLEKALYCRFQSQSEAIFNSPITTAYFLFGVATV